MPDKVKLAVIDTGLMARYHIQQILKQPDNTEIAVVCETDPTAYAEAQGVFRRASLEPPPNQPDFTRLLADYAGRLQAAMIITPHALHHDQATACLEAGLDVLLEKPMVMNASEARSLIETRATALPAYWSRPSTAPCRLKCARPCAWGAPASLASCSRSAPPSGRIGAR